MESYYIIRS